ncbi:cytochrome P450 [Streptacidiphilus sp. EB129]|uniref:cytochrome P450 n=1 Tax=Streptacidiphilus sp. EB129 TaxID=3156262 RepID=UPI0035143CEC
MTTPHTDHNRSETSPAGPGTLDPAAVPPPGCPAHGLGTDGIRRLYGEEAEADPTGLYEKLRAEHGAVAPVLLHGDLPAWLVLGHRENLTVMRTSSTFSRDSRRWKALQDGRIAADSPLLPMVGWQPLCVFADGEEHKRLRGAVTDSLGRFDRRGVRRHVTRFADQLIDAFAADGRADLVSQFAEQLPMLVMTQLLGMPEEYGPRLVAAARDLMKGTETALASNDFVVETLRQLLMRKAAEPSQDLTSWLMSHDAELSQDEVLEHLRLILVAANETTVNLIANTLRMVLTDDRFRANLSGGHMTLPDALEQVLWDEPPLAVVPGRWATGDTELAGQQIKEGDMLLLALAAGNVDPQVRPDLTTPVHGNRSHLSFSSGPHECPGQDLGRAIADTGIDVLLTRLADVHLAVDESGLSWTSAWLSRHLAELPVEFRPRTQAPRERTGEIPAPTPQPAATAAPDTATATVGPAPSGQTELPAPVARRSWWRRLLGR